MFWVPLNDCWSRRCFLCWFHVCVRLFFLFRAQLWFHLSFSYYCWLHCWLHFRLWFRVWFHLSSLAGRCAPVVLSVPIVVPLLDSVPDVGVIVDCGSICSAMVNSGLHIWLHSCAWLMCSLSCVFCYIIVVGSYFGSICNIGSMFGPILDSAYITPLVKG